MRPDRVHLSGVSIADQNKLQIRKDVLLLGSQKIHSKMSILRYM
jgi:hypothetical protein